MKILIAEDEEDVALSYMLSLQMRGHTVIITKDGEECITRYKQELQDKSTEEIWDRDRDRNSLAFSEINLHLQLLSSSPTPFDAVILDYKMPKKDGMEVAKEILEINPNQRIIFISAYVKETLEGSIKQLKQVVELIQKPVDSDVLVDTIEEDKQAFEGLKTLMKSISKIDEEKNEGSGDLAEEQIRGILEGLRKIHRRSTFS